MLAESPDAERAGRGGSSTVHAAIVDGISSIIERLVAVAVFGGGGFFVIRSRASRSSDGQGTSPGKPILLMESPLVVVVVALLLIVVLEARCCSC